MAKTATKPSKSNGKSTVVIEKTPAKRGRPSTKKEPETAKVKEKKKKEKVKDIVETIPVDITEKAITQDIPQTPQPEPEERAFDIYDYEPVKQVIEMPVTDLQTQTQLIIKRYSIDYSRLPQDVLNKVNDYLTEFRSFLANPNDVSKIGVIMQKDQSAYDAINAWIEPKREYFEQMKLKEAGGIAVTTAQTTNQQPMQQQVQQPQLPDGKIVVDRNNSQQIIDKVPSVPSSLTVTQNNNPAVNQLPFHNQAGNQGVNNNYNQQQLNPRNPTSEYQHIVNVGGNNINLGNNRVNLGAVSIPKAFDDNREEIDRVIGMMNQGVSVANSAPINLGINPDTDFLEKYAETIIATINSTFQMNWWKYIPLDILKGILANTEKSLSYEIVMGGENTYIKVSNGQRTVQTAYFNCQ